MCIFRFMIFYFKRCLWFPISLSQFSLSQDVRFYLLDYRWMFFLRFFPFCRKLFTLFSIFTGLNIFFFSRLSVDCTSLECACNDKSITFSSVSNCFYFVLRSWSVDRSAQIMKSDQFWVFLVVLVLFPKLKSNRVAYIRIAKRWLKFCK